MFPKPKFQATKSNPVPQLLLVWNENPESVKFFLINPILIQAEWARASNNLMINSDDLSEEHPIYKLNTWLGTDAGKATQVVPPIHKLIGEVVISGLYL